MSSDDYESGTQRTYYCRACADHYSGGRHCPDCGAEGELA